MSHDSLVVAKASDRQYSREVVAAILEGQPLPEIARLITDIVARHLSVERVGLYLRDSRRLIAPIALRKISSSYAQAIAKLVPTSPVVSRAEATGLPVYARNVQNDPQIDEERRRLYQRENINSILMIMLQYEQRFNGALVVYPDSDRHFSSEELSTFQSLADMATVGIAMSQQLQQQREMAMLEERNRLGREIHDTVAQSLAALILQIDTAQTVLRRGELGSASELLVQAHAMARNALEDTRRAVRGLAAATVQTLSPAEAIAQEVQQFEAESGIPAQFIMSGEEEYLSPDQRTTLLRITQEALTNARKHAQPQRVRVGLQYGAHEVRLLVEDDGKGFDASATRTPGPEGGYGLFGMEERALLVNAQLEIDSTPGWGTRIRLTLPYGEVMGARDVSSALLPQDQQDTQDIQSVQNLRGKAGANLPVLYPAPPATTILPPVLSYDAPARLAPAPSLILPSALPPPQLVSYPTTRDLVPISTARIPSAEPTMRVLIVDDHALARQGIRGMLELDGQIEVVGEATDGAMAVEQAIRLRPDVVLMDLQMPGVDGIEGLRRLRVRLPEIPVVILTTIQTDQSVSEALAAGARGFLLKDTDPAELSAAVRAAKRGETLLASAVADRLALLASPNRSFSNGPDELNDREREVLQLLAQGARNKEIATALFIAPKTVETHLSNIFRKLDVSNRTEAARVALERGLVTPTFRPSK